MFEFENTPFCCLDSEISTPTARGGQTLVRLKIRNLLTSAVFEKTFKAQDKFKEPDLQLVPEPWAGTVLPCQTIEEWLYDRGPGNMVATLRFRAGVLQSIRYSRSPR